MYCATSTRDYFANSRVCGLRRRLALKTLALFGLCLAADAGLQSAPASVSAAEAGLTDAGLQRIGNLLQGYVDDGRISGVVAAISRPGMPAYFYSAGWQDREAKVAMTTDAVFQIREQSMALTTVAAMQLVEQGRLSLTDPVSRYIPRFAHMFVLIDPDEPFLSAERKPVREVTIEDLLTDQAGFGPPGHALYEQRRVISRGDNLDQLVNKLAGIPLMADPGRGWSPGLAKTVLGRVIEIVTGQALDDYLAAEVFAPWQMADTGFFVPPEEVGRLAATYERLADGSLRRLDDPPVPWFQDPPLLDGGTGLVSTAADYLAFMRGLTGISTAVATAVLQPESVQAMTRNHIPSDRLPLDTASGLILPGQGWGYGVHVLLIPDETGQPQPFGQFGAAGSLGTYAWADPHSGVVAVLMMQIESTDHVALADPFWSLVRDSIGEPALSP